jgi:hypothetical protein
MGIVEQQQAIVDAINEREAVDAPTALEGLQNIYRDKRLPLAVRMRAMKEALPHESPRLAVIGHVAEDGTFAERLERALSRSHPKLIEHQPDED